MTNLEELVSVMVDHPSVCGRPRYHRAYLAVHPGLLAWLESMALGRYYINHITPFPFMVRAVMCSGCGEIYPLSKIARYIVDWVENLWFSREKKTGGETVRVGSRTIWVAALTEQEEERMSEHHDAHFFDLRKD